MKRKNIWSTEDDKQLTEIVFRYLRNRSTQLKAFEEAAELLGRTKAACGFRWNSFLRTQHAETLVTLIGDTKGRRRTKPVAAYLHCDTNTEGDNKPLTKVFTYIKELEQTIANQQKEIEHLRNQVKHDGDRYIASEDLQTLMKIITQARRNGYLNQAN
ncbi:hypothetical protein [Paenibacillus gansuensis]|uniref:Myb-like domain-containing protein n=1 Tax=Paenibacillus gansuensis TaxID=306542 RepID=A0ABW5PCV2_9BACL